VYYHYTSISRHFPGELLSVKPYMATGFPGLFHVNERVAWLGKWRHGFFSLTAVGATNVGSIHAAFDGDLVTNQPWALKSECSHASTCSRRSFHFHEKSFEEKPVDLSTGDDFGHFEFGSTIVLIFEAPKEFGFGTETGRVRVGERLVQWRVQP
jgi:phosphatidylserine decarboxylase